MSVDHPYELVGMIRARLDRLKPHSKLCWACFVQFFQLFLKEMNISKEATNEAHVKRRNLSNFTAEFIKRKKWRKDCRINEICSSQFFWRKGCEWVKGRSGHSTFRTLTGDDFVQPVIIRRHLYWSRSRVLNVVLLHGINKERPESNMLRNKALYTSFMVYEWAPH